jgi:hypothetical protein
MNLFERKSIEENRKNFAILIETIAFMKKHNKTFCPVNGSLAGLIELEKEYIAYFGLESEVTEVSEVTEKNVFETMAEISNNDYVKLDAKTQRKLFGYNVFGRKNVLVSLEKKLVKVMVLTCFSQSSESVIYSFNEVLENIANKKVVNYSDDIGFNWL